MDMDAVFYTWRIVRGGVKCCEKLESILVHVQNLIVHKGIKKVLLMTFISVSYFNIVGRYLLHNLYAEYFYDSLIMIFWVFTLFTWIIRFNLSDRMIAVIKIISPLTMGIYIIHPIIIKVCIRFWVVDTVLLSLLYFIDVLLISAFIAWIIYKIPLVRWMIKL